MSEPSIENTEETEETVAADEVTVSEDSEAEVASPPQDDLAAERDAYKETLQRLQADFENYRKRVLKQQAEATERANESLVTKLLSVLDTIDMAKQHEPSGSLEQIAVSLFEVLSREGLERIDSVEQPFDPTLHEAVAHEAGEGEPKVSEEMRAGYTWKGRVIRPAMVKVVG